MTKPDDSNQLDNVIRFPVEAVTRLGFQRAERGNNRAEKMEGEGQMTLFEESPPPPEPGKVVPLPLQLSPFEEALMLDEQGDERAEDLYTRGIEEEDRVADAWCNLGVLRSIEGDLDSAFDCFAQSLAEAPRHARCHFNLAKLYFEIGDLSVARAHYEIALDVDNDFINAWFNYGLVTALAEDYRTAHDALTRYKQLAPGAESENIANEILGYIETAIHLS